MAALSMKDLAAAAEATILKPEGLTLQQAEEGGGGESAAAMSEALRSVEAELLAVTQQREALAAQMEALQRRGAAADAAKEQQHAKQLEALTLTLTLT